MDDPDDAPLRPHPPVRLLVAGLVVGILSLQAAWLVALPPFYGIDEVDHAYRSSAIAHGHWAPGTVAADDGRGFLVPASAELVTAAADACEDFDENGPDNCEGRRDSSGEIRAASAAAAYNPVSYLPQAGGWLVGDAEQGLLGARVVAAITSTLMIAAGAAILLARFHRRWALLMVMLVSTPTLIYSSIVAAPNGAHYAAAFLLWCCVAAASAQRRPPGRVVVVLAALSGASLVLTHTLGIMWLAVIVAVSTSLWRTWVAQAWRHRRRLVVAILATWSVAAIWTVAWVVLSGTNDPRDERLDDRGQAPPLVLVAGHVVWLAQSVATLRTRSNFAPVSVYVVALAIIAVVVLIGRRDAGHAARRTIDLSLLALVVIPVVLTVATHPWIGAAWQGRYALPLYLGVLVVASIRPTSTTAPPAATVVAAGVGVCYAQMHTLTALRAQVGGEVLLAPLALVALGVALLTAVALAATRAEPAASVALPPRGPATTG